MPSTGTHQEAHKLKYLEAIEGTLGPSNADTRRMRAAFFRLGEGGVLSPGLGVRSPLYVSDGSETNIRAPSLSLYWYEKALDPSDLSLTGSTLSITVSLDTGEGNGPGVFPDAGGDPEFSECGIFDESGTMIAYFQFPPVVKNSGTPFSRTFNIRGF